MNPVQDDHGISEKQAHTVIVGPIAGGVSGAVAAIIGVVCVILLLKRRRRTVRLAQTHEHITPMDITSSRETNLRQTLIPSTPSSATAAQSEKAQLQRRAEGMTVTHSRSHEIVQGSSTELSRTNRKQRLVPTAAIPPPTRITQVPSENRLVEGSSSDAIPSHPWMGRDTGSVASDTRVEGSTTGYQIQDVQATIDAILRAMDHHSGEGGMTDSDPDGVDEAAKERLRLLREKLRRLQGRLDEEGARGDEDLPGYESHGPTDVQGHALPQVPPAVLH